jgi:hypothetical protein
VEVIMTVLHAGGSLVAEDIRYPGDYTVLVHQLLMHCPQNLRFMSI